jgi:hypothetical protein
VSEFIIGMFRNHCEITPHLSWRRRSKSSQPLIYIQRWGGLQHRIMLDVPESKDE